MKEDLKTFKDEFTDSQKGMTRSEKIALAGACAAVVATIVAVFILLQGAPTT